MNAGECLKIEMYLCTQGENIRLYIRESTMEKEAAKIKDEDNRFLLPPRENELAEQLTKVLDYMIVKRAVEEFGISADKPE